MRVFDIWTRPLIGLPALCGARVGARAPQRPGSRRQALRALDCRADVALNGALCAGGGTIVFRALFG